jgi:hypothetical protein
MRPSKAVVFAFVVLCCAGLVQAQTAGETVPSGPVVMGSATGTAAPPHDPDWGISSYIALVLPGWTFNNLQDSQHGRTNGDYIYRSGGTWNYFDHTLNLPSGAQVFGMSPMYYDVDTVADVHFYFYRETQANPLTAAPTFTLLLAHSSSGSGGYSGSYQPFAAPETIRNWNLDIDSLNRYLLTVNIAPSGSNEALGFGGVIVWYKLQISPAPASATFSDVPTGYWAFRHIEALAASGITAGCGTGTFCPEQYVKRSEMAVYLAKALGLHWADS